jgi:hypothetical protein
VGGGYGYTPAPPTATGVATAAGAITS